MATDKNFVIKNGLTVGTTEIVDSSANLTNIGAITSSGNLNVTGDVAINSDDLVVSSSNSRVGINVGTPLATLDIDGDVYVRTGHTLFTDILRPYATTTITIGQGTNDIAKFTGSIKIGNSTIVDSSRNLTNIGTISSGVHTITSSGTIGGATVANAYLKVTDGSDTLGFDSNEVHSTTILYINSEAGEIRLRGNNGNATALYNGATQFMSSALNLFNIGTISSGAITSSGDLAIDTDTLFVDVSTDNVGIGSNSPVAKLDVADGAGPTVFDYSYATNSGIRIHADEAAMDIVGTDANNHASSLLLRNGNEGFGFVNSSSNNTLELRSFNATADNFTVHSTGTNVSNLVNILTIEKTGNATFAGTIDSGAITTTGITVDSRLVIDGASIYDNSTNGNNKGFRIGGSGLIPLNGSGTDTNNIVDIGSATYKFKDLYLSGTASVSNITSTGDTTIKPAAGSDALFFNAHNSESQLRLYNNRQDLSNVPVSSIVGYNSVQVSKIQFYRGSGGSSGYINFQVKPQNGESLTDTFQIGDNNTVDYGVNVRAGGYRVGGQTVIDSSRNLTNIGTISSGVISANSGATNVVATFTSTDATAAIALTDNTGTVELSATGTTFGIQPNGAAAVLTVNSSGNLTTSGTISSGAQTITSTGTIGTTTPGNGYLQITDGSTTLALDPNEIYSSDDLVITTGGDFDIRNGSFSMGNEIVITSSKNIINVGTITASGLITGDRFLSGLGTAASPAYKVGDSDSGFYDSGANFIGVTLGGVLEYEFKPTQLDLKSNALKTGLITVEGNLLDDQTMINIIQTNTASDISTQESFIDFTFIDSNANNYPQVKIGAQVGQNADADSQLKEGSGAFVVHTNNATTADAGGQSGMAERMRVDYQGHLGLGINNPAFRLHAYHSNTNVVARFESGDGQVYIDLHDSNSGTYGALLGHSSTKLFHVADASVADRLVLDNSGNLSVTGDVTAAGNMYINTANDGLYFAGGNNRIYFTNNRALEGATDGSLLQVGEGYSTIAAQGNLTVTGYATITSNTFTKIYSSTNGASAGLTFSDAAGSSYGQAGNIKYVHQDGISYGSQNSFILEGSEPTLTVLADGKLMFKEGLYLKPSSGTGAGTQIIDSSGNITASGYLRTSGDGIFGNMSDEWQTDNALRGGNFSADIGNDTTVLKLFPASQNDESGNVRAANDYSTGIAFMHLDPDNSGWGSGYTGAQAWIGLKVESLPGQELDSFVIATNGSSTSGTMPTERFKISSTGVATFTGSVNLTGGGLALSNYSISAVNDLAFNDPGPNEGLSWSGGNIKIYESPDNLTTNSAGNLQVVYGSTRRLTVNSTGIDVNGNITAPGGTVDVEALKADDSGTTPGSCKLHVGTLNSAGSSAIAQFGGFIRAATHLIVHSAAGAVDSVFMSYTEGDTDFRTGEGSGASPSVRVNALKINTSTVITSAAAVQNITSIAMSGNLYMSKSQPWIIIENTTEDAGGIVFNDNQAGASSTAGPGSSSQQFRITYNCGSETLVMGHDDDSYAGFNFGKGGDLTCSGNVTAYSDERLKENIQTLDGKKALQMRGVSFTKDGKEGSGVIAQELEEVAPELVTTDKVNGIKSVAYGNLVGYLIEAVKEQQKQIEELKEEVSSLRLKN